MVERRFLVNRCRNRIAIVERSRTKRDCPFPRPIEIDRLADVDNVNRPAVSLCKNAYISAPQAFPLAAITELLANRRRGVFDKLVFGMWQKQFAAKPGRLIIGTGCHRHRMFVIVDVVFHDGKALQPIGKGV